MKLHTETNLLSFDAWSGAKVTKATIIKNNKSDDFDYLIDELYPDGLSETKLNDILWFDDAFIFEALGIREEEEE